VKKYIYIYLFICKLLIIFEKAIEEGGKNFKKKWHWNYKR